MQRPIFQALARREDTELVRTAPVAPLPVINDQPPVILIFDHRELAIDLAYERFYRPGGPRVRSATRDTTLYWIPKLTPVFAVSDGYVVYARKHVDGHTIVIDHCNGWATVYSRVEHIFVTTSDRRPRPPTQIAAGDILGYLGATKTGPLVPLRFELWKCNRERDYEEMDALRYIRQWRQVGWQDARLKPPLTFVA